jgi:hypothetical protein
MKMANKRKMMRSPLSVTISMCVGMALMARCSVSFAVLRYFVFKAKRFGQLVDGLQVRIPVMEPCVPALVRLERTAQVSKGAAYCV